MFEPARRDSRVASPVTSKRSRGANHRHLSPLVRDIGFVLIIKVVLLTGLWWAFFRHPVAADFRAEPRHVREHVFPSSSSAVTRPETAHADR
jgi:hypothetical protein